MINNNYIYIYLLIGFLYSSYLLHHIQKYFPKTIEGKMPLFMLTLLLDMVFWPLGLGFAIYLFFRK